MATVAYCHRALVAFALLSMCISILVHQANSQHYFGGIGKNTWAVTETTKCMKFFEEYLPVEREANECPDDTCPCATQARVHFSNATGAEDTYRPFAPYVNETMDFFGIHAPNCKFHPFGGRCTLDSVERDFQAQFDTSDRFLPLMNHNLGLWTLSLEPLITAWNRDRVRYFPMRWVSNGKSYYSALVNPCGTMVLEFISSDIGDMLPNHFQLVKESRMDFDLPMNNPAPPSKVNPMQLTALKISRATYKLDEVEKFYKTVFNADVLLKRDIPGGGKKLVLKLPDTGTGKSTVQLQFWMPAEADDVPVKPSPSECEGWTAAKWERLLNEVAESDIRSPTCGFPKSLDFHFSYDCIDPKCVQDNVVDRLTELGAKYRWLASTALGDKTWWLLYFPDPTGYGVETHYIHAKNTPSLNTMPPSCFGIFKNMTCPGTEPGQCT